MIYICESKKIESVQLVGGKGHHLQRLVSWNAPVAPFFIITTESFKFYGQHQYLPEVVEKRFEEFFLDYSHIALRSSMISEDHAEASFAGLFDTRLDVNKMNWKESLLKIFESVNSDRVQEYIKRKNLNVDLQMAVVAQELIQVEKSGVLFTRSPVEPTSAIAIDAAFGMGEGVVSGHSDVDHYQYTRNFDLISCTRQTDGGVLDERSAIKLIKISLGLEKKMKVPCDIEWGMRGDSTYIFQIRPITHTFKPLVFLVDTNLSESYPGTVSPFTASFVKKAYENVFYESAVILGASGPKLKALQSHYRKLISQVDDHLYYNLEHYYAVLRSLPGGTQNIDHWHKMIGGRVETDTIPYHTTELTPLELVMTVKKFIRLILFRKIEFQIFLKNLELIKTSIEDEARHCHSPQKTILFINELIDRPLGFGMTVVNDIFIMMGLGSLSKVLRKKNIEDGRMIDLLKTSTQLDSVKPLEKLNSLVKELSEEFLKTFEEIELKSGLDPYPNIFKVLTLKGFSTEVVKIKQFIDEYGDRSFEELKLESLPMKNDPLLFRKLLIWASKNQAPESTHLKPEFEIELSWWHKKVLQFTKDAIAVREASRLWRGKFYHLLREQILKLTEQLKGQDQSWNQFSVNDFFSVDHHEWKMFATGVLDQNQIQSLMRERNWASKKKSYPEVISWVEDEALPNLKIEHLTEAINGQGVSPGVIEGTALVLDNPSDALLTDQKEFILVTKNTDPAWVYIMSRSLGLVSEKGSLLSHTAIIGRELNIPTIVGVKNATKKITSGSKIRINGSSGAIEIL